MICSVSRGGLCQALQAYPLCVVGDQCIGDIMPSLKNGLLVI
jgi:hypothetical protein